MLHLSAAVGATAAWPVAATDGVSPHCLSALRLCAAWTRAERAGPYPPPALGTSKFGGAIFCFIHLPKLSMQSFRRLRVMRAPPPARHALSHQIPASARASVGRYHSRPTSACWVRLSARDAISRSSPRRAAPLLTHKFLTRAASLSTARQAHSVERRRRILPRCWRFW